MAFPAVIARGIAGAAVLMLVGASVATAIPSFKRTTQVKVGGPHGGLYVVTGKPVPDEDRADLKPPKTLTKLVVTLPAGTKYTPAGSKVCSRDRAFRDCPRVGITRMHMIFPLPDPRFGTGAPCQTSGTIRHGRRKLFLSATPSPSCTPLNRFVTYLFEARFTRRERVITIDTPDWPVNFFVLRLMSRELVQPPERCPRSGRWAARAAAHYEDGTDQSVVTRQRCSG